ncbi:YnbE family lipoprotein [Desulfobacter curvatus]|uniref:YnbE family lipoprotein n=1 Tax=Desulfobacter curvatus TaxID=2290 RepID=UPI000376B9F3|nr:YnbE family lipoprotein [Desulfobacter curvatus]
MLKQCGAAVVSLFFLTLAACSTSHEIEVKPVEIKPIHITIDVNVKVDKALDDFFGDIDAAQKKLEKNQSKTGGSE